jgi:hypothetical protein
MHYTNEYKNMNDEYKDTGDSVNAAAFCFAGMLIIAVIGYIGWIIGSVL